MSKGLEALEDLRFQVGNIHYFTKDLKQTTREVRDSGLFETIKKELEVLEIIKRFSYYDIHFLDYLLSENKITQEEYDLLKEVLLWD